MTRSHRAVGNTVGDIVEDNWRQSQIHVVTRSHRAMGDTVETQWETQREKKWGTKPDPCRDNISQSSGRLSGRQSETKPDPGRDKISQNSGRHSGDTVGGTVGDNVGD